MYGHSRLPSLMSVLILVEESAKQSCRPCDLGAQATIGGKHFSGGFEEVC
jgi:hypothetical protein